MKELKTSTQQIDLRGVPCPVNFIRVRLLLEDLDSQAVLQVDLDRGEAEESVLSGLTKAGYKFEVLESDTTWIRILVISQNE